MKQYIFLLIWLGSLTLQAQDRTYIDKFGNPVEKEKAEMYREVTLKGNLYHIKDYYLNGQLQMDAFSKTLNIQDVSDLQGEYTFYYEDGKIQIKGETLDEGMFLHRQFDPQNRLISEVKYNDLGIVTSKDIVYQNSETDADEVYIKQKDSFKRIVYDGDIQKIRFETLYQDSISKTIIDSYDADGKLIGSLHYDQEYTLSGIQVEYHYKPMRIKSITNWDKGTLISQEEFYPNGQIFSRTDTTKAVFYDNKGRKKSELSFQKEKNGDIFPYQGTKYEINQQGIIHKKIDYQFGNITFVTQYYQTGKTKSVSKYTIDGTPEKITFYTPNQKEKATLTYLELIPYDGTYYVDLEQNESSTTYNKGELTLQQIFDTNNKIRYIKKKQDTELYFCQIFDEKGDKQYEYTLKTPYNEMKISQFQNGKIIRQAVINNGIIQEGSISFVKPNENLENIDILILRNGNWITIQEKKNNKLIKETKILDEYFESESREAYISEQKLSQYVNIPSYED